MSILESDFGFEDPLNSNNRRIFAMMRFATLSKHKYNLSNEKIFFSLFQNNKRTFLFKKKVKETQSSPPPSPPQPPPPSQPSVPPFDETILQYIACPLNKKPLRYDPKTNELVNDELGIAYPIHDGIPVLLPQEAHLIRDNQNEESKSSSNETQTQVLKENDNQK
jgi:uncharacterized protein YbaR (Trm112 family)